MKTLTKKAALAAGAAIGLSLLAPVGPAQAYGGHPVQNTCAGTGGSILGYSNSQPIKSIGCGSTMSDVYKVNTSAPYRVQKANSTFSVCYSNGVAASITYSSRAWTVSSC